jgi:hypothetical protein
LRSRPCSLLLLLLLRSLAYRNNICVCMKQLERTRTIGARLLRRTSGCCGGSEQLLFELSGSLGRVLGRAERRSGSGRSNAWEGDLERRENHVHHDSLACLVLFAGLEDAFEAHHVLVSLRVSSEGARANGSQCVDSMRCALMEGSAKAMNAFSTRPTNEVLADRINVVRIEWHAIAYGADVETRRATACSGSSHVWCDHTRACVCVRERKGRGRGCERQRQLS